MTGRRKRTFRQLSEVNRDLRKAASCVRILEREYWRIYWREYNQQTRELERSGGEKIYAIANPPKRRRHAT